MARNIGIPWQFFDDTGAVLAGGSIEFFQPGTSNYATIYKEAAEQNEHTQPITLDSAGRPPSDIFLNAIVDVTVKDSSGSTIESILNHFDVWSAVGTDLSSNRLSNHSFETAGTGGEPVANWTETDSGTVISRDTSDQSEGAASLLFTASASSADSILSDVFEVDALQDLVLSFDIKANNASAQPKIEVDWLDSVQAAISSSTVYSSTEGLTPTAWTRLYGLNVTPPATARYAQVKITGNQSGTSYNVAFDNLLASQTSAFNETDSPSRPFGLILSRDAGDTSHDINVTAGSVKDENGTENIVLRTEITKQMDATHAVGDDAGGMESGGSLPSEGIIYVWLIKNPTTGNVDVLGSLSASAPTLPSGYTVKRRIGAWLTDATNNLLAGVHRGNIWYWTGELIQQFSDTTMTDGEFETATVDAPPNCLYRYAARVELSNTGTTTELFLRITEATTTWTALRFGQGIELEAADLDEVWVENEVLLDGSSQLKYAYANAGGEAINNFDIYTIGWIDLGRDSP
ncbi:hypothetical protein [Neptunomonas sp.]|uniref:hypothetical protein n=1 Tax=Neptunomonas sp. TaxID=1971898 RepID=UPI00356AD23A